MRFHATTCTFYLLLGALALVHGDTMNTPNLRRVSFILLVGLDRVQETDQAGKISPGPDHVLSPIMNLIFYTLTHTGARSVG
jgi:hypothetical protein